MGRSQTRPLILKKKKKQNKKKKKKKESKNNVHRRAGNCLAQATQSKDTRDLILKHFHDWRLEGFWESEQSHGSRRMQTASLKSSPGPAVIRQKKKKKNPFTFRSENFGSERGNLSNTENWKQRTKFSLTELWTSGTGLRNLGVSNKIMPWS